MYAQFIMAKKSQNDEDKKILAFLKEDHTKPCMMKTILSGLDEKTLKDLMAKKTKYGGTLTDQMMTGLVIPTSLVGAYASDEDAYKVFEPLYDPMIKQCHKLKMANPKELAVHGIPPTPEATKIDNDIWKEATDLVVSSRVRMARNVAGYPFSSTISAKDRLKLEAEMKEAVKELQKERGGKYYSLGSMSKEEEEKFKKMHLWFTNNNEFQESAGTYRDWPEGRGLYVSDDAKCVIWVNEEDHIRAMSTQQGPDLAEAFNTVTWALSTLQKKIKLSHHERLGYMTCCPTNVGTCLRASVHIKLVHVPKLPHFKQIIQTLNLQTRGTGGEDTDVVDNTYDISNKRRFGLSEKDGLTDLQIGVETLALIEKSLAAS